MLLGHAVTFPGARSTLPLLAELQAWVTLAAQGRLQPQSKSVQVAGRDTRPFKQGRFSSDSPSKMLRIQVEVKGTSELFQPLPGHLSPYLCRNTGACRSCETEQRRSQCATLRIHRGCPLCTERSPAGAGAPLLGRCAHVKALTVQHEWGNTTTGLRVPLWLT